MKIHHAKTKAIARILLGSMLVTTGMGHLTFLRREFRAQVPDWVPLNRDDTVVYSGIAEIALGAALIALSKNKATVGKQQLCFLQPCSRVMFRSTHIIATPLV